MASEKTIVLITGANGGIGYETALLLATSSPSYHVIIGSRSTEKGQAALETIQSQKPSSTLSVVQLDVTSEESLSSAYKSVSEEFGRLDVLINNAGIVSFEKTLLAELKQTFETNTFGAALTTEKFLPLLEKSKSPRVLYITSVTLAADPQHWSYSVDALTYRMSKAALNMLMVSQHKEFQKKGIKVWAICPGYVITNLTGEADRENRAKQGAESPTISAQTIQSVVEGKRDQDVGKVVHKDGVYDW
ncbi:short chain dehydrogenase protein [Rutstroemia sp. NJR-2017a BBW]|nr:short chain dehydrogenase protein [Rutstroemia sp. NJR-2017a BBW]